MNLNRIILIEVYTALYKDIWKNMLKQFCLSETPCMCLEAKVAPCTLLVVNKTCRMSGCPPRKVEMEKVHIGRFVLFHIQALDHPV